MSALAAYIPEDRRRALARGESLPEHVQGTALFVDISGFTPLTEALTEVRGASRGAEELTRYLNQVYDALIEPIHAYRGSVIGFSGDAMTCWFDEDDGLRAATCALSIQKAMKTIALISITAGRTVTMGVKTALASGKARRFLVGDPEVQVIEVLAGSTLDRLAATEHLTRNGEVVLDKSTVSQITAVVDGLAWRDQPGAEGNQACAVITGLHKSARPSPWPTLLPGILRDEQARPWVLPPVYERYRSGLGEFLSEMRPVVTVFMHFTGIDYDGDPQAGEKLDRFIRGVQQIFNQYNGSLVAITMGEKGSYLSGIFGAPLAYEDDALRSVSAALEMHRLPSTLPYIQGISIGISQGTMRTGEYGGRQRHTYGVMGDHANLAARLMQSAAPGQTLVSSSITKTTGEVYSWSDLGAVQVKGKAAPVQIYALQGRQARGAGHTEAQPALPLVGRRQEIEQIRSLLSETLTGKGQIIGISAEAGLGKSRLVAELLKQPECQSMLRLTGEAQSYAATTSYLAWQPVWRAFFGLNQDQSDDEQEAILAQALTSLSPALAPRMPLLSPALRLALPDNDLTRAFNDKLRKTSLETLLVDCLRIRSQQQPVLIVLEDCQWLDSLSQELLQVIGRAIAGLPAAILLTYRPFDQQRLDELQITPLPHFTALELSSFSAEEAHDLILHKLAQIFGQNLPIPPSLVRQIVRQSDGNPFYIEELINYLKDQGLTPEQWQKLEQVELPASLHSLILSRVDQASESQRATLKVASIVGRSFQVPVLSGAFPDFIRTEQARSDLDVLDRMELTILDVPDPEPVYLFKHVITHQVTYESLPFVTRSRLHEAVGNYYEASYQSRMEQYYDLLAHHYRFSENTDKKRRYLLFAAERARKAYNNNAARAYYQEVLPLLEGKEKVQSQVRLGQLEELAGEWEQAGETFLDALKLAVVLDDRGAQALCQSAYGELMRRHGRFAEADQWLHSAEAGFRDAGDLSGLGQTLQYLGTMAAQRGVYDQARQLYEQSLELRHQVGDQTNIANLYNNLGIVARYTGDIQQALALHDQALSIRRELDDRWSIANSLNNLGNAAIDLGQFDLARNRLEEAVRLQREVGDRWATANSLNNLGNAARAQGDFSTASRAYHESLEIVSELGDRWALAYLLEDVAGLAAGMDRSELALKLVAAASQLRVEIGAPLSPAEQERLERLLLPARQKLSEPNQAEMQVQGCAMTLEEATALAVESCQR